MGADNLTLIVVLVLILAATYYVFSGKFTESSANTKSSTAEHLENVQSDESGDSAASSASGDAQSVSAQQASASDGSDNSIETIAKRAQGPNNNVPVQTGPTAPSVPEINGPNDELAGANLESAYGTPLDKNDTKDPLNSSKLLPTKDKTKNWFDDVEAVNVNDSHLINIYRPLGVNSIGQGVRNRSYDLRGTGDAVCPQFTVSPWLQSSIQPDRSMKSLC